MEFVDGSLLKRVVCRPALPMDTPDVMELTHTIWEGQDYVPKVWEKWLADPEGRLVVAEHGGKIVGLVKLSKTDDQEWWLEGLRVHPQFEGRRIASRLHDYVLNYWYRNCSGVIRLATGSLRIPVHHLCERTGFRRIGELTFFVAPVEEGEVEGTFSPVIAGEVGTVLTLILQNQESFLVPGLMDLGWQWVKPSENRLISLVEQSRAWWWCDRGGFIGLVEDTDDQGEVVPVISAIACPPEKLSMLLRDYRRLAANLGYAKVCWVAPLKPEIISALDSAGFYRDWDQALYIYEKWQ